MQLISLSASNFLSFNKIEYSFLECPVLVQGENNTDKESQENNGSGKSALGSIISYCLIHDALRKSELQDIDLITWEEDKAVVELVVFCGQRGEELKIRREIPRKGSTKLSLTITKDGSASSPNFANVKDGNQFILNWLGIDKEDIKNYFLINRNNYKSFFSSSNTDKLRLIGRFSNAECLDGTFPLIDNDCQVISEEINDIKLEISKVNGKKELLEQELSKEQNRDVEQEYEDTLLSLDRELKAKEEEQKSINKRKEDLVALIKAKNSTLTTIQESINLVSTEIKGHQNNRDFIEGIDFLNEEIKFVKEELLPIEKRKKIKEEDLLKLESLIKKIDRILNGKIICPKCKYSWVENSDKSVAELEEERGSIDISKIEKELNNIEDSISTLTFKIKEYQDDLSLLRDGQSEVDITIDSLNKCLRKLNSELSQSKQEILTKEEELKEENIKYAGTIRGIAELNKQISSAEKDYHDERLEELTGLITLQKVVLDRLENDKVNKEAELVSLSGWKHHFKDFKMQLAKEQLIVIQKHINSFLSLMKSDLTISIEGFKKLASGEIREEITPLILRDSYKKFGSFSGGEQCRMEIAMILAIQEMINSTNPYGGLKFLNIDEITEGMDSLGIKRMMDALQNINQTILVTTHVTNKGVYPHTLLIKKENGISSIQ